MALVRIRIENSSPEPAPVPDHFGGGEVPPGGTAAFAADTVDPDLRDGGQARSDLEALRGSGGVGVYVDSAGPPPSAPTGDPGARLDAVDADDVSVPVEGGRAAAWVAPDGDDTNDGTRSSPYATIQKAVDALKSSAGHSRPKLVRLRPGVYTENVVVGTANLTIEGEPYPAGLPDLSTLGPGEVARIEPADASRPAVALTNATDSAWESFQGEGGLSHSESGGSYSYDGASVDRSVRSALPHYSSNPDGLEANVTIRGVAVDAPSGAGAPACVAVLGVPTTSGDPFVYSGVELVGCYLSAPSGVAPVHAVHALGMSIRGCRVSGGPVVADRCPGLEVFEADGVEGLGADQSGIVESDVVVADGRSSGPRSSASPEVLDETTAASSELRFYVPVGSGVRQIESDLALLGGASHDAAGGEIDGNVRVGGGASADLKGLRVLGDLVSEGSGTSFHAVDCHVQKGVLLDGIDTEHAFDGGTIVGQGVSNKVRAPDGSDMSTDPNWKGRGMP